MAAELKKTPLFQNHVALGAKMVPFGGWHMPVQYEGILAEYTHTRKAVSIFDTSHMGEFFIKGNGQETGLDHIVTMSLQDLPVKACRYGFVLNETAGVIDDLIVFRVRKEEWFIVVNGATIEKDSQHFKQHLRPAEVFEDRSTQTGKIDVQGPASRDVLKKIFPDIEKLNYYTFDYFNFLGKNILISRTGYTGELGFEVYPPADMTAEVWKALLKDERVRPAGLGARDILRLECGYSLYGHELSDTISPVQAGLMKFVDLDKDFIGRSVLLQQKEEGPSQKIIGFVSESRRAPREQQRIYDQEGKDVGRVTSGTFSPALQKGIGLGLVDSREIEQGRKILFGNEKVKNLAVISKKRFFTEGSLKE